MANQTPAQPQAAGNGGSQDRGIDDGDIGAGEGGAGAAAPGAGERDGGLAARVKALEGELAAARDESQQQREQALRALADADNVRKRAERDLENAHKYALERFVGELLPVKDSLELGLAAAGDGAAVDNLREGTEMTLRLLSSAVEKFGVREVNPLGEAFNPEVHQAMSTRESAGAAPGTVLEVVQKGYLLNDRLVRPALVIVARDAG